MKLQYILALSAFLIFGCKKDQDSTKSVVPNTYLTSIISTLKIGQSYFYTYNFDNYGRTNNTVDPFGHKVDYVYGTLDGTASWDNNGTPAQAKFKLDVNGHLTDMGYFNKFNYDQNKLTQIIRWDTLSYSYNGDNLIQLTESSKYYHTYEFYSDKPDNLLISSFFIIGGGEYPLFPSMGKFSKNLIKSETYFDNKNKPLETNDYTYITDLHGNPTKVIVKYTDHVHSNGIYDKVDTTSIIYTYR